MTNNSLPCHRGRNQRPSTPGWRSKITADTHLHDLQNRVEQLLLAKKALSSVELLRVRRKREKTTASLTAGDQESLAELQVEDVFRQRLQQEELTDEQQQQLTRAFQEILDNVYEADNEPPMAIQHGLKEGA